MTARSNNLKQPEPMSYRVYVRHARLLRGLPRPSVPKELRDPAFLEAIYERAVTGTSSDTGSSDTGSSDIGDLGALLAEALPPLRAPEEASAGDLWSTPAADRPELVAHFDGSRDDRAPGWLWQRIRADLRRQQLDRRRHAWVFRLKVAAAAAVFLVVGTGITMNLAGPMKGGEASDFVVQVQRLKEPIGEAFHPTDRLRQIAGRDR